VPTFRTASEEQTIELGERLAGMLPARGVALLIGNLGAGKTTLAKGIVKGRGAAQPEEVSSPTYTLIHEYGGGRVYHVDLYRLDDPREVARLGLRHAVAWILRVQPDRFGHRGHRLLVLAEDRQGPRSQPVGPGIARRLVNLSRSMRGLPPYPG